jgi:hypothetical protein
MKNKHILIIFVLAISLFSCKINTPYYVYEYDNLKSSEYGAYVEIKLNNNSYFSGELIEASSEDIVLLRHNPKKCARFMYKDISKIQVNIAKPIQTLWSIPLFAIFTISHGFYSIITLPINLISTITINYRGSNLHTFNHKTIKPNDLNKFARFPQGIPENITFEDLEK